MVDAHPLGTAALILQQLGQAVRGLSEDVVLTETPRMHLLILHLCMIQPFYKCLSVTSLLETFSDGYKVIQRASECKCYQM